MNITLASAIFAPMTDLRDQQLAWLDNITASSGLTVTDIARRARLNPSTLTRFRAQNDSGHTLTSRTVSKIEEATGVPAYEQRMQPRLAQPFGEAEASLFAFDNATQDIMVELLRNIVARSNSIDLYTLKTQALSALGYDEGNVVVVDRDVTPRPGDIVCAQRNDWRRGTAEIIFRVYRTPYLMTANSNGEPGAPDIVDGENIVIKGVIVGGCRLRA